MHKNVRSNKIKDRKTRKKLINNSLEKFILLITQPKFLIGFIIIGFLGIFFEDYVVYQTVLSSIILIYLIPIFIYFFKDIITIDDFVTFNIKPLFKKKQNKNTNKHKSKNYFSFSKLFDTDFMPLPSFNFQSSNRKYKTRKTTKSLLSTKSNNFKNTKSNKALKTKNKTKKVKNKRNISNLIRKDF